jgi:hypothetical protein
MNLSEGYFKVLKKASVFGIGIYNIIVNISVIFFRKKKFMMIRRMNDESKWVGINIQFGFFNLKNIFEL